MRRSTLPLVVVAAALAILTGCAEDPASIQAGSHASTGRKLAIRPISNKTQESGLEDALATTIRDEFLRDGRYQIVPEKEAEDVIDITVTHYLLTPIGYGATLLPISYKLSITADLRFVEHSTNRELWTVNDITESFTYPNQIQTSGQTEAQAQATIWTLLAPTIVARVADGIDAAHAPTVSSGTAPTSVPAAAPAPH